MTQTTASGAAASARAAADAAHSFAMANLPVFASSGVVALDDALGGLFWGDNVVLREAGARDDASGLVTAALGADGYRSRLAVTFGGPAPAGIDAEDVGGLELEAAISRILACAQERGTGALLVVGDLARAIDVWGLDGARRLFTGSCPALLRLGAVAYWTLGAAVPPALADEIRRITQVVIRIESGIAAIDRAEARPLAVVGSSFAVDAGSAGELVLEARDEGTRVGAALAAVRVQRGLTQTALARIAGVSPSAISQAERGTRGLSVSTLVRLAAGLGVSLDELIVGPREPGYRIRGRMAPHRGGASRVALLDGQDEPLRVYEFRLDPGAHGSPPARSQGTEAVLLGQGLLLVTMTDGTTPVIREGEALFAGKAGIADWRNLADDDAVGFWIGV